MTPVCWSFVAKAVEADVEEARVRGAQLNAYAEVVDREVEDGEDGVAAPASRALLSSTAGTPRLYLVITWDSVSLTLPLRCERDWTPPLTKPATWTISGAHHRDVVKTPNQSQWRSIM